MYANYFALSCDDHDIGIFADLERRYHWAVAVGGLEVDHSLAASRSDAIFSERSALAISFFRHREHQRCERLSKLIAFEFIQILRAPS